MPFDPGDLPYPSRRAPVLARNAVATSQPLAAQAGLEMLRRGGNAVDAALAAAVALTVVEPTSNGLGGDAFALVWDGKALHGLNGSGRSPAAWTPERFAGRDAMPDLGWDAVTVPGAVDAWARLSERFGRLDFPALFEPALAYAREGFPVAPVTAFHWERAAARYAGFDEWRRCFLVEGRPPRAGTIFRNPGLADSLAAVAGSRGEAFYRGPLAGRLARASADGGGALTADDLAAHRSEWVAPLAMDYRGIALHELPPNGQGIAALVALGILARLEPERFAPEDPAAVHLQVEAMRAGLDEARRHVADPAHMAIDPRELLDDARLARHAATIDPDRAADGPATPRPGGGTVNLAAADAGGMMVSFIQSNYMGFGSGVVVPGTGISLQNRGAGFTLEPGHPNRVGGGKRPFHTIIPGFVTEGGAARLAFGLMGGPMQAQGHVQMILRIFGWGQNPQAASDAPRWQIMDDGALALEPGLAGAADALRARGHRARVEERAWLFGGAQLVHRLDGAYLAASDHRKDGQAVGF
ncbi:MAG: gamma-glutamyltransferase family protein [Candidatus Krumholzibacteriota bacterium]|nr:gamma-glutamyltransferase family protein [Candidatus Krumholzibacteriota bacterium]